MLNYETLESSFIYLILANCKAFVEPKVPDEDEDEDEFFKYYKETENALVGILEKNN